VRHRSAATFALALGVVLAVGAAAPAANLKGVNFISLCGFSHRAPDDPIVYPGQQGVSHDHSFVGNTSTDADSTPASLRKAGRTTCSRAGDTAAYWMPTVFVDGRATPPSGATIYYQRSTQKRLRPFPSGLEMIAGNRLARRAQSLLVTSWDCGDLENVPRSPDPPACPERSNLRLRVNFPDCWNGKALDSLDHRSHMAYSVAGRCPRSHPVAVPALSVVYRYPTTDGPGVSLASGSLYSAHADFVNAWDQKALAELVARCLNRLRHCGTGS
jgi:uncharacterized protein DUF1996